MEVKLPATLLCSAVNVQVLGIRLVRGRSCADHQILSTSADAYLTSAYSHVISQYAHLPQPQPSCPQIMVSLGVLLTLRIIPRWTGVHVVC
jgi:hypothetical protein